MADDTRTVPTKPRPLGRIAGAKVAVVSLVIIVLGVSGAAASSGSGGPPQVSAAETAASPGRPFHRTELYFGMNKPNGEVTEEQFQHFLEVEVTKRFPDGLTLLSGLGQFQDETGTVVKEKSKLLILLYPLTDREANREIEEIREAYKAQFEQFSVLRVDTIERVSF